MDRTTAPNSENGAFKDTNVAQGKPGTTLLARDLTAHQEEILSVIEEAGIVPDSGNLAQLLEGVKRVVGILTAPLAALAGWSTLEIETEENISSIVYGNNLYLVGTFEGGILTSTDGLSWIETAHLNEAIVGLGYGNGLYIAGTNNGKIYTSHDGKIWTLKVSIESGNFKHIEYGNGLYVAGSVDGKVYTSTDGEEWNHVVTLDTYIDAMTFGGELFVIGTGKNVDGHREIGIYTSKDGSNWALRASPSAESDITCLSYGNGVYAGFQDNGKAFYSGNGINWFSNQTLEERTVSVCFGRGFFFASTIDRYMYSSRDGKSWTKGEQVDYGYARNLIYGRGMYLGLASSDRIVTQFILGDDLT